MEKEYKGFVFVRSRKDGEVVERIGLASRQPSYIERELRRLAYETDTKKYYLEYYDSDESKELEPHRAFDGKKPLPNPRDVGARVLLSAFALAAIFLFLEKDDIAGVLILVGLFGWVFMGAIIFVIDKLR